LISAAKPHGEAYATLWACRLQYSPCWGLARSRRLVSRILIMPMGTLAETALAERLAGCVLALIAYHLSRHNLFVVVGSGVAAPVAVSAARAVWS
jgi:hypothetical protein